MKTAILTALLTLAAGTHVYAQVNYEKAGDGTRVLFVPGVAEIKMLVEESNLGSGDVEVGEITLPAGAGSETDARSRHSHGSIEIFYVLDGELEHIVNGESHLLTPGMVGIVRPEDNVVHRVPGDEPVRALIIWAPGGEADRLGFNERPIE